MEGNGAYTYTSIKGISAGNFDNQTYPSTSNDTCATYTLSDVNIASIE